MMLRGKGWVLPRYMWEMPLELTWEMKWETLMALELALQACMLVLQLVYKKELLLVLWMARELVHP